MRTQSAEPESERCGAPGDVDGRHAARLCFALLVALSVVGCAQGESGPADRDAQSSADIDAVRDATGDLGYAREMDRLEEQRYDEH